MTDQQLSGQLQASLDAADRERPTLVRPPDPAQLPDADAPPELPADDLPWTPGADIVIAAPPTEPALDPHALSLTEIGKVGRVFFQSGYFRDARDAAQAITKILAGQELGIGPFAAMSGFHVVEGKPTMSAGLIGGLIKRSGKYDYKQVTATDQECEIEWYEKRDGAWDVVGSSSFSMKDAARAKLLRPGSGWEKYPVDMLWARALTAGARRFAPDCFSGAIYTAEELGAAEASDA